MPGWRDRSISRRPSASVKKPRMSARVASRWRTACFMWPITNRPGALAKTLFGKTASGVAGSPGKVTTGTWGDKALANARCSASAPSVSMRSAIAM